VAQTHRIGTGRAPHARALSPQNAGTSPWKEIDMKQINAYLNFHGNCREAMSFYARCFETELQMVPFPPGDKPTASEERIMHAALVRGGEAILMASDTAPGDFKQGNNVWLNVQCETVEEIERLFSALGEGGTVRMPLHDAFWGSRFGMRADRYGTHWMFNYELKKA
jgi:PhnB protein